MTEEPDECLENEECELCIFHMFGNCQALGDTKLGGDCPSFTD